MGRRTVVVGAGLLSLVLAGSIARAAPDRWQIQQQYLQRYIFFANWGLFQNGVKLKGWIEPVEGLSQRPLSGPEFYKMVGRPDLAKRYRARRAGRIIAGVIGGLLIPGGLACIIAQGISNSSGGGPKPVTGYVAGGIMIPAGFAGILTAIVMNSHPVSPDVMRQLADGYNRDLRRRLGLDDPAPSVPVVVPMVTSQAAGLAVTLRF